MAYNSDRLFGRIRELITEYASGWMGLVITDSTQSVEAALMVNADNTLFFIDMSSLCWGA